MCACVCVGVGVCACGHPLAARSRAAPAPAPQGELDVVLCKGRNLPVWGFPGQSNPYCRLILGEQVRAWVWVCE